VKKTSITARILAALALMGAVAAVLIVVNSETGDDGSTRTPAASQGSDANAGQGENGGRKKQLREARVYEVQEGDSLTAIAEQTGVPVETLEELNPDVDPQALIPGQKLKLR
jgi:LysM repeat protein